MNDLDRLAYMVESESPCISIVTLEEEEALELIVNAALMLHQDIHVWSMGYGIRDGMLADSPAEPETDTAGPALSWIIAAEDKAIYVMLDLGDHLHRELTQRLLRDAIRKVGRREATIILIDHTDKMPAVIKSYVKSFELSLPDKEELSELVKATLRSFHRDKPIELGISVRGFEAIVRNLQGLSRRGARSLILESISTDQRFDDDDLNEIIAGKRRLLRAEGLLEYIETPLDLEQIGGMVNLKKWLERRKESFKDQGRNFGLVPPKGVLMLGVQGAGKSLCAKAIATAWQQPLFRMDPSSLYAKYIGESEQNLRKALEQTEMMAPVILWIDEIEKAFASAAAQSSDGGLSKRMFGTLLTWMQDHEAPVFIIATANDIEALPPELLRKGRFDEIFFVGLPEATARKQIFEIHLKKRKRDPTEFDLAKLAKQSEGFSGAEIEQAIVSGMHVAFSKQKQLSTEHILAALEESPPLSVTMKEKIASLYAWAEGRCVPAN